MPSHRMYYHAMHYHGGPSALQAVLHSAALGCLIPVLVIIFCLGLGLYRRRVAR